MFKRTLLLILFFAFVSIKALAAVFTVTSNADRGSGTLREALTLAAANDSTQTDYITFNLPDLTETGRTINLTSQLPDLSSNLVIDGSTQPGAKFGRSDARVMLAFQLPVGRGLIGLKIENRINVAVYGLYINLVTNLDSNVDYDLNTGILLNNDKNIQIGALGRGNVIYGFYMPTSANAPDDIHHNSTTFAFQGLTIQDSFIGIAADGETLSTNVTNKMTLYYILGQIHIGGIVGEGNLIPNGFWISQQNNSYLPTPSASSPAFIYIQNNKIGIDYDSRKVIANGYAVRLSTFQPGGKSTIHIEDNVVACAGLNGFSIENISSPIYFVRNYISTDKTLQNNLSGIGTAIFASYTDQLFVGSDHPADANFITKCRPVYLSGYATASINKNSFFCTVGDQKIHSSPSAAPFPYPSIAILSASATSVESTATSNSSIELFYSDHCGSCSPETYFASTTADANGRWQYNGILTGTVIASATLNNSTSEFTKLKIDVTNIKVISTCNGFGSIKGVVAPGATNFKWVNAAGDVVGTQADLIDVPVGYYKLFVDNGSCEDVTDSYSINNGSLILYTTSVKKVSASCNKSDGSITGITYYSPNTPAITWTNDAGVIVGNAIDLTGVPAGSYTLTIKPSDNSCTRIYGPIVIPNATGPGIDQFAATIKPTNCGQSTGSITGITATGTGTLKYSWKNELLQQVATTADLTNQPAGKYTLQVTDETTCGPVYTTELVITETNGIALNDAARTLVASSCGAANGSVTGIIVTGATSYKWVNAGGATVATTLDLRNALSGAYTLTASNNFGCSQNKNYIIAEKTGTQYPAYETDITGSCTGQTNGAITVNTDGLVLSSRWVNSQNVTIGTNKALANIGAGSYSLYLTDANGCESFYNKFVVFKISPLTILSSSVHITNDQCGLKSGGVADIQISGGDVSKTRSYTWTDNNGKILATTLNIDKLEAGSYKLVVHEQGGCNDASLTCLVNNVDVGIPAVPTLNPVDLCSPGNAVIAVVNPDARYSYRLYDTGSSLTPIAEKSNGSFKITATTERSYYVSQFLGNCESARGKVDITISGIVSGIPNAFTPNGDGVNDFWKLTGIENKPSVIVQIFNRYGDKIFDSKGYAQPFDGTANGKALPVGTYYYVINFGSGCKLISGNVTIIR